MTYKDWALHLEAVDDAVLRSGTLRAAAGQIRRLQHERNALIKALSNLVTVTQHLDPCPETLRAAKLTLQNVGDVEQIRKPIGPPNEWVSKGIKQ